MSNATDEPRFLGVLNGISQGETNAGVYLSAWADATTDPDLRNTLACVAERESTHGIVFRQRIERLGFNLEQKEDPEAAKRVAFYGDPSVTDLEKTRALVRPLDKARSQNSGPEPAFTSLEELIRDEAVDQLTRDTLRWYVAEERDSVGLLRACATAVEQRAGAPEGDSIATPSPDAQAIMACMTHGFQALQQCLVQLAGNGRSSGAPANGATTTPSADAEAIMACVTQGFEGLNERIDQLRPAAAKRA